MSDHLKYFTEHPSRIRLRRHRRRQSRSLLRSPRRSDRRALHPDHDQPVPPHQRMGRPGRHPRRRAPPTPAHPGHPHRFGRLPAQAHRRHDRQPVPPRPRRGDRGHPQRKRDHYPHDPRDHRPRPRGPDHPHCSGRSDRMTSSHYGGQPRPLPIRPRPVTGETTLSYIRRLARANHLRPNYLRRCLRDAGHDGIRLDWLAIMAGRPVTSLERALADTANPAQRFPARQNRRQADKAALLATIRTDAYQHGLSIRGISDRHGVGRRVVLQALDSPVPRPRKKPSRRTSRLDPFTATIDDILTQDLNKPHRSRRTVKSILDELTTRHGLLDISYSTLRGYVAHRRSLLRPPSPPAPADTVGTTSAAPRAARRGTRMSWSPAHHAVEHEDLPRLRDLLDAGHDVEDDNGDGWTLLRHAVDVEHDGHVQTGEPLHTDVTAFLLACGPTHSDAATAYRSSRKQQTAGTGWPSTSCAAGSTEVSSPTRPDPQPAPATRSHQAGKPGTDFSDRNCVPDRLRWHRDNVHWQRTVRSDRTWPECGDWRSVWVGPVARCTRQPERRTRVAGAAAEAERASTVRKVRGGPTSVRGGTGARQLA